MINLLPDRVFRKFPLPLSIIHYPRVSGKISGNFPENVLNGFPLSCLMEINGNTPTKKRKLRSWLWEHYKASPSDLPEATCNHCGVVIITSNGTNKMKNHLVSHSIFKSDSTNPSETKKPKPENPLHQVITTKLYVFYFLFTVNSLFARKITS
jgi:hypothetical protein